MDIMLTYVIVFALLLVAELAYFKIADKFNIIDKPNQRSSHSTIVLRGGGIIFSLAMVGSYDGCSGRVSNGNELFAVLGWHADGSGCEFLG